MPRVKCKMIKSWVQDRKLLAQVQFNMKCPPNNMLFEAHWGSKRTIPQNNLYWKYLSYLIEDAGLKEQGHFSPQALHLDLKQHFLSKKAMTKGEFKPIEEATTTTLSKSEFSDYLKMVDEFVCEFFEIDTSSFWESVEGDI